MASRVQASLGSIVVPFKRTSDSGSSPVQGAERKGVEAPQVNFARTARPRIGTALRLSGALNFAGQVLEDMGTRMEVALQTGQEGFTKDTMGSVQRVAEMTRLSEPVEWPDVPPREIEAGEVLLPLRRQLAESLRSRLYQPDLEEADAASVTASIEQARRRLDEVSKDMERDVEVVLRQMFKVEGEGPSDVDGLSREVRRGLADDGRGAVKEAAGVGAEDVLALVR